jgi:hypothetical protein
MKPYNDMVGYQHFEDLAASIFRVKMESTRSSKYIGILPHYYMASQPRRPQLERNIL